MLKNVKILKRVSLHISHRYPIFKSLNFGISKYFTKFPFIFQDFNVVRYPNVPSRLFTNFLTESIFGIQLQFPNYNSERRHKVFFLNKKLRSALEQKKYDKVETLFRFIETNYEPTSMSYAILMQSFLNQSKFVSLEKYFLQMKEKQIPMDESSYLPVILSCLKLNQIGKAIEYIEEMSVKGIPILKIYDDILFVISKQIKNLKWMELIFQRMKLLNLDISEAAYNSLLEAYGLSNNFEKVNKLIYEMRKKFNKFSPDFYSTLLIIYGFKKDLPKINHTLLAMKRNNVPWTKSIYNSLIQIYANDEKKLEKIVSKMKDVKLSFTEDIYINLIYAYSEQGNVTKMFHYFNNLKSENFGDIPLHVYQYLLEGCLFANNKKKFFKTLDLIKTKRNLTLQIFSSIVRGYRIFEETKLLSNVLDEVIKQDLIPDITFLNVLVHALLETNTLPPIIRVLNFILDKKLPFTVQIARTFLQFFDSSEIPPHLQKSWNDLKNFIETHSANETLNGDQVNLLLEILEEIFLTRDHF